MINLGTCKQAGLMRILDRGLCEDAAQALGFPRMLPKQSKSSFTNWTPEGCYNFFSPPAGTAELYLGTGVYLSEASDQRSAICLNGDDLAAVPSDIPCQVGGGHKYCASLCHTWPTTRARCSITYTLKGFRSDAPVKTAWLDVCRCFDQQVSPTQPPQTTPQPRPQMLTQPLTTPQPAFAARVWVPQPQTTPQPAFAASVWVPQPQTTPQPQPKPFVWLPLQPQPQTTPQPLPQLPKTPKPEPPRLQAATRFDVFGAAAITMGTCQDQGLVPILQTGLCEDAAHALGFPSLFAKQSRSNFRPEGCYNYVHQREGSIDLYMGRGSITSGAGHNRGSICLNMYDLIAAPSNVTCKVGGRFKVCSRHLCETWPTTRSYCSIADNSKGLPADAPGQKDWLDVCRCSEQLTNLTSGEANLTVSDFRLDGQPIPGKSDGNNWTSINARTTWW